MLSLIPTVHGLIRIATNQRSSLKPYDSANSDSFAYFDVSYAE